MAAERNDRPARVGFVVAGAIAGAIVLVAVVTMWASDAAVALKVLGTLGGFAVGAGFLLRLRLVAYPEETKPFEMLRRKPPE